MCPQRLTTQAAMPLLLRKLSAIGRYSSTPFIVCMYGTAEMAQAFCRAAAVGGATYMLCVAPTNVEATPLGADPAEGTGFRVETSSGVTVRCRNVVSSVDYLPLIARTSCVTPSWVEGARQAVVVRVVAITDGPLLPGSGRCSIAISPNTPPFNNPQPVYLTQMDSSSGSSPDGYCVLYGSTLVVDGATNDVTQPAALDASIPGVLQAAECLQAVLSYVTVPAKPSDDPEPTAGICYVHSTLALHVCSIARRVSVI